MTKQANSPIDELFNTIPADAPAVDSVLAIDPVADMRAKAAAEKDRIAGIEKVCGDGHAEIAARARRYGWDVTRTELEMLRADRPKAPAAHDGG